MYFDSFGNLRLPKETISGNSVIKYNRMPHQRYGQNNCGQLDSFYERLTSNLRTDIALFKCSFETCRWRLHWQARVTVLVVSYFLVVDLGDGDYELGLTDFTKRTILANVNSTNNKFYYGNEEIVILEELYELHDI